MSRNWARAHDQDQRTGVELLVDGQAAETRRYRAALIELGFNPNAIIGEAFRIRGAAWLAHSLEWADLLAIATLAAWEARQERPDAGGGLIRLKVRWALHEALRKEAHSHGLTKAMRRREQGHVPERHCRCGKSLGTMALGGVRCCPRCQLKLSAESSRRYRERKQLKKESA